MADRSRLATGQAGERRIALEYRRHGYTVIAMNWRCRGGEIDVIVSHDDLVCFVEVKTRRGSSFGGAPAAVGPSKQSRVRHAAQVWIAANPEYEGHRFRFDVATVVGGRVQVIAGAF